MGFKLRDYQENNVKEMYSAWLSYDVLMYVLFTGGGKTKTFTHIIKERNQNTLVLAHRQELVLQMSLTLAEVGIYHRLIASTATIRTIIGEHLREFGKSFHDPSSRTACASVQTMDSWAGTGIDGEEYIQDVGNGEYLHYPERQNGKWYEPVKTNVRMLGVKVGKSKPKNMKDELRKFVATVEFWVGDEGHHYLKDNIWGRAIALLPPRCQGLLVTATPQRADGKGLGSKNDGLADKMIFGPPPRELIRRGYLVDYRIIAPPSDIDESVLKRSKSTGDYTEASIDLAVGGSSLVESKEKQVVGDIVSNYLKFGKGLSALTFVSSLEIGAKIVEQFESQGVTAFLIHGGTTDRNTIIRKFKNREIMQLVNVGVLGEGTDLPCVDYVAMARHTLSLGLYIQIFGRLLRTDPSRKEQVKGILVDHVGNVKVHGLPDKKRDWSLDGTDSRKAGEATIKIITCDNEECYADFEAYLNACPHCGKEVPKPEPGIQSGPEFVDGDLFELDEETLAKMRGDVEWIDNPQTLEEAVAEYRAGLNVPNKYYEAGIVNKFKKRYNERLEGHEELKAWSDMMREAQAWYGGHQRVAGLSDNEIFKKFYLEFGVDWLSAQALPIGKIEAMYTRVVNSYECD